jgi:hypothetical protein
MSYYNKDYFKYLKKIWFLTSSAGINLDYDEENLCPLLCTGEEDENAVWKEYEIESEIHGENTISIYFKNGVIWTVDFRLFDGTQDVLWRLTDFSSKKKVICTCGAYKIKDLTHSDWCDIKRENK